MSNLIKKLANKLKDRPVGVVGERKEFSVLIPLIQDEESVLFEVRGSDIRQAGDVCFPGGRIEEGETPIEAALRETEEEIGIPREEIKILGRFDSVLEVNRIRMNTVVGVLPKDYKDKLKLAENEVSEVFTVPMSFFLENEPDYFKGEIIQDDTGFPYSKHNINPEYKWRKAYQDIYFWHFDGQVIWGLTAVVMEWFIKKLIRD